MDDNPGISADGFSTDHCDNLSGDADNDKEEEEGPETGQASDHWSDSGQTSALYGYV